MSLPGGPADKLSNRYEDWWTLHQVAELLRGQVDRMRLEWPGQAGRGVEFWALERGVWWGVQVKDAKGTWTIGRLVREEVLTKVSEHLSAGHNIRLVLSTTADDLSSLSCRARSAETVLEYREILTATEDGLFKYLRDAWQVSEVTAWSYLQRIFVEHQPETHLRRLVHQEFEILVQGDAEVVINELRGWFDDALHRTLTAPLVWSRLEDKGFRRRLLAGDPGTSAALAATTQRHRRGVENRLPTFESIPRDLVSSVINKLSATGEPQVLTLHGRAGSGKSKIAADVVAELTANGWHAATIPMDKSNPEVHTAAQLGRNFDLDGSPSLLLSGVTNGSPGVLFIDQLDAVSDYSGRMPDAYDAVDEMIEQTEPFSS